MRKIFIVEFKQKSSTTLSRVECTSCGWGLLAGSMLSTSVALDKAKDHVCPVDKRTVGIRDWRAIARDAFLDDRDAEAIAIIAEMEPNRLRVPSQLREALAEAIAEIENHNSEYHHVTAITDIERWKKIGDLK